MSKRAELMLELVVDIKNNRKREGGKGGAAAVLSPTALKWLKQCRVEDVALGDLSWDKLLSGGKRGAWWLPTAAEQARGGSRLLVVHRNEPATYAALSVHLFRRSAMPWGLQVA